MSKKAVDVVLLPTEGMTEKVIEANKELIEKFGEKIVLHKEKCLPHISLAMGCIEDEDVVAAGEVLETIAVGLSLEELEVVGIEVSENSVGEKVSVFEVRKTVQLQRLHKEVMEKLSPYFGYDVDSDMIYGQEEVAESTLLWIKNFPEKSSFANFSPHITIGYGEIGGMVFPMKFTASKLALCHLGNHCTCREVLVSVEL
ncbi:MAG: 2'-5' RNA ligase family protein [Planctomycetota bacterium]|jgi:2'-5' RNA ligase